MKSKIKPISHKIKTHTKVPKKIQKITTSILKKESEFQAKTNQQLQAESTRLQIKAQKYGITKDLKIEAFALVRETAHRIIGLKAYPVQLQGALILNDGDIAEMQTGEGKTLTSLFTIYLNALTKKGVHVITVNNYLAKRDATLLKPIYEFLGLTVGLTLDTSSHSEKKDAYKCDITYGTHSEFGFDYLRDRLATKVSQRVCRQNPYHFALIDEVDSVLIDEAKTPLIISGGKKTTTVRYQAIQDVIKQIPKNGYTIDYNHNSVVLTIEGIEFVEKKLGISDLFSIDNVDVMHLIVNALRSEFILKKDIDYIVDANEIKLVDKFTGRIMNGRQLEDGLQQAIQAKEHVKIQKETTTQATITYQNFFRLYEKLSGMTGTAYTEKDEFHETYNMRVIVVPTNKPNCRIDHTDRIFATKKEKFEAILTEITNKHQKGQPLLIGVTSVNDSNFLSKQLKKLNIPHNVLNATKIASESKIIAKAGQKNMVTIATNMAGRGTDIKLGDDVTNLGGLCVIGSEHNTARRIDNQLRGRAARQGDVGESIFYSSFEDEIIKRFSNDKLLEILNRSKKNKEGLNVNSYLRKQMDEAQIQIEGNDYNSRKNTLQYDVLIDQQRKSVYKVRDSIVEEHDRAILKNRCLNAIESSKIKQTEKEKIKDLFLTKLEKAYSENQLDFIQLIMIYSIDRAWTLHIDTLDKLRKSAQLKSYAQINPVLAYQEQIIQQYEELRQNTIIQLVKTIETVIPYQ